VLQTLKDEAGAPVGLARTGPIRAV
jgi:hypothetical protein